MIQKEDVSERHVSWRECSIFTWFTIIGWLVGYVVAYRLVDLLVAVWWVGRLVGGFWLVAW